MGEIRGLDPKSTAILWMISEGYSDEGILKGHPAITREDIATAAREALAQFEGSVRYQDEIRKEHPRAYEKWTPEEEDKLRKLHHDRVSVREIAEALQRQPSAIRSRLAKLALDAVPKPDEAAAQKPRETEDDPEPVVHCAKCGDEFDVRILQERDRQMRHLSAGERWKAIALGESGQRPLARRFGASATDASPLTLPAR